MANKLRALTGHLSVILGLMFLVFLVLDQFNPLMNFVDNGISHWLLALLSVSGIIRGVLQYAGD